MLDMRATLVKTQDDQYEMDIVFADPKDQCLVIDGIEGKVRLLYVDKTVCSEIEFNEYFANTNGSFKVAFSNLPDYPYWGAEVELLTIDPQLLELQEGDAVTTQRPNYMQEFTAPLER